MKYFIISILICISHFAYTQNTTLKVVSKDQEPIDHANIYNHKNERIGSTDHDGFFTLLDSTFHSIRVNKTGYREFIGTIPSHTDTFLIILKNTSIKEVEITSKKNTSISKISTETLDKCELGKLACCNLAESFENSNTVDVTYSDGITGGREIQMLGLAGVYSQQLMEGTAYHRGITSKIGLDLVPGPWIESIGVNKGIGSVANGFENITGQINIEFKKPKKSESFFINGYISEVAKSDFNIIKSFQLKENLFTNIMGHTSFSRTKMDNNKDGFIDMPLFLNLNLMNKWQYFAENGFVLNASLQVAKHEIEAGQLYSEIPNSIVTNPYTIQQNNTEVQGMVKMGWELDAVNESSFAIITRVNLAKSEGNYGVNPLLNKETFVNITPIYQTKLNEDKTLGLKLGYSLFYDRITEDFKNLTFQKKEFVNGAFAESSFSNDQVQAIVGLRGDYHSSLGFFLSPRASVTFTPSENHTLKLSSGLGFRTPSILTEASGYLMSNRVVTLPNELKAEKALNSGISYRINYNLFGLKSNFEASYFLTLFRDQILYNLENEGKLDINYSNQESRAQNIQIENIFNFTKNISLKLSYKNDVNAAYYDNIQKSMPLIKTDKFLSNLTITSTNQKWRFSNTILVNGPTRIPNLSMGNYSPWHPIVHGQLNFIPNKNFDIYIGSENIFSFTQQYRIVQYENPNSPQFDASMIWGPLDYRRLYIGFKYSIN